MLAGHDLLLASWQSVRVGGILLGEDHPSEGLWLPTHRPSHGSAHLSDYGFLGGKQAWRGGAEGKATQAKARQGRFRLRKTVE